MPNFMGTEFWSGYVGPGQMIYNSVDLGFTINNIEIERIPIYKEITVAQQGSAMYEQVQTGEYWRIRGTVTDITLTKIAAWNHAAVVSGAGTAVKFTTSPLYKSFRDNYAKTLLIKRTDENGAVTTQDQYILTWPKAIVVHTSEAYTVGPEDQRVVNIEFHALRDTTNNLYGYSGAASSNGL